MLFKYPGSKLKCVDMLMAAAPPQYGEFRSPFCGNEPLLWVLPTDLPRWINDVDEMVYLTLVAMRDDPQFIRKFQRLRQRGLSSLTESKQVFDKFIGQVRLSKDPAAYLYIRRLAVKQVAGFHRPCFASYSYMGGHDNSALNAVTTERMREARRILQGVKVTNLDYTNVLRSPVEHASCWFYLDPPYYSAYHDSANIYAHEFSLRQRAKMKREVLRLDVETCKVMISVEESEYSHPEYALDARFHTLYWGYASQMNKDSEGKGRPARELLVRNYGRGVS